MIRPLPSDELQAVAAALPVLVFGPFRLDRAGARLLRDGQLLDIAPKPWAVLCYLAERPGQLVSKEQFLDGVWGHRFVSDSVLKTAVNSVRVALGEDAARPTWVHTVARRGYRFGDAVVTEAAIGPTPGPVMAGSALHIALPEASPATALPIVEGASVAPLAAIAPIDAAVASLTASQTPSPTAVPIAAAAGNLPRTGPALVGRAAELAALTGLLAQHRLVTVTGLGGVGKTRLALDCARAWPTPIDGIWLLRLDDLHDPTLLAPALAQLLRLGQAAAASVHALARSLSAHQALLVLDNAEHIASAVAALAAELLGAAPRLSLLVTSQVPLRVQGEQLLPLTPLALPDERDESVPAPQGYAAAQLLCERIAQLQPGWQPATAEHADIAAICRALDGVPLALELAAARVPLLGVGGVRARLDQRFVLLTRGPRDAAARHRTLAAALDWAVGLLSEAEREALQRLAVFAGSFRSEDALGVLVTRADGAAQANGTQGVDAAIGAAPVDEDQALDLLDELRARSLLVLDMAATSGAAARRLRLYDSVRGHALAALNASGRDSDARLRHLHWMGKRFESAHLIELTQPTLPWLVSTRSDVDSLRAALRFGLHAAAPATAWLPAIGLAAHSAPFWALSGQGEEGWRWLQAARVALDVLVAGADNSANNSAAQSTGTVPDPQTQGGQSLHDAKLLLDHAVGHFVARVRVGSPAEALTALRRSRVALLARRDAARAYLSYYAEFYLLLRVAPKADFAPLLQAMGALYQAHADQWPPLARRWLLGVQILNARAIGDYAGCLQMADEHAALGQQCNDLAALWVAHNVAGQALALLGRLDEACDRFAQAVADIRTQGMLREQFQVVAMAAALHLQRRLDADSRSLAHEALRILAFNRQQWWMADALPWAAWHDGRPGDALTLQAWADRLMAARGEGRGPVFAGMRQQLVAALATQGLSLEAARALPQELNADAAAALALAGPGPKAWSVSAA